MCTSVYPAIYICAYPECFWQVVTLVERPVICVSQFYSISKKTQFHQDWNVLFFETFAVVSERGFWDIRE